jgi:hypothetical protein
MTKVLPLLVGYALEVETHTPPVDVSAYCHLVGQIIFLCHTHPNLSYAVGIVYCMHSPQKAHWDSVKHVLRYLNFTSDFGILYSPDGGTNLHGYTNSDYLGCNNTCRSMPPKLAGGPISWSSKQQPTVSDSTTKAEYNAFSEAAKEGIYMRRLFEELQVTPPQKVPITCQDPQVHADLHDSATPTLADLHLSCGNQGCVEARQEPPVPLQRLST